MRISQRRTSRAMLCPLQCSLRHPRCRRARTRRVILGTLGVVGRLPAALFGAVSRAPRVGGSVPLSSGSDVVGSARRSYTCSRMNNGASAPPLRRAGRRLKPSDHKPSWEAHVRQWGDGDEPGACCCPRRRPLSVHTDTSTVAKQSLTCGTTSVSIFAKPLRPPASDFRAFTGEPLKANYLMATLRLSVSEHLKCVFFASAISLSFIAAEIAIHPTILLSSVQHATSD